MSDDGSCVEEEEDLLPWEPAGRGVIATGNVASCAAFWRTVVRNSVAITWIEEGYRLLLTAVVPKRKERCNAPLEIEHSAFRSGAVAKMLAVNAVTLLPLGEKPMVVSPLGIVM